MDLRSQSKDPPVMHKFSAEQYRLTAEHVQLRQKLHVIKRSVAFLFQSSQPSALTGLRFESDALATVLGVASNRLFSD